MTFTKPAGIITILGNNSWYEFWCIVPGIAIRFESGRTQQMVNCGTPRFHVQGSAWGAGSEILLRATLACTIPQPAGTHWLLSVQSNLLLEMDFVWVDNGWATPTVITTPPPAQVQLVAPEADRCPGWIRTLEVSRSDTEDSDGNGTIDALVVTVPSPHNGDFTGFAVHVAGYTLAAVPFSGLSGSVTFRIHLREQAVLDTDAHPCWWVDATTTLKDTLLGGFYSVVLTDPVGGEHSFDKAPPLFEYTLASADKDRIFLHFSEPVERPGGGVLVAGDFVYSGAALVMGLTLTGSVTAHEAVTPAILIVLALRDQAVDPYLPVPVVDPNLMPAGKRTHRVTDVGLGLLGTGMVEPVFATDQTMGVTAPGLGYINVFDGTRWLRKQQINLQASLYAFGAPVQPPWTNVDVRMFYDVNVPAALKNTAGLWMPGAPGYVETEWNGLVPDPNSSAVSLSNVSNAAQLRDFVIPPSDSKLVDGSQLEFFFEITYGASVLYCARLPDPAAANWYRTVVPWAFDINEIKAQKGSISILNNVINPDLGQVVTLQYIQPKAGSVTISVFDLAGSLVRVLTRAPGHAAGDYAVTWDGKNKGGRSVSRGVYFIRIVAPGIDETREVLVVR